MLNKTIKIIALILITGAPLPAYSVYFKDYDKHKDTQWFKDHVYNAGIGVHAANVFLSSLGREKIYCSPEGLELTQDSYLEMLDETVTAIKEDKLEVGPNDNVIIFLPFSLARAFPCK